MHDENRYRRSRIVHGISDLALLKTHKARNSLGIALKKASQSCSEKLEKMAKDFEKLKIKQKDQAIIYICIVEDQNRKELAEMYPY